MKKHTMLYLVGGGIAWWLWDQHKKTAARKAAAVAALAVQAHPAASPLQTPIGQSVSP